MGIFLKIFIGFWVLWFIWYVTGGPLRDDKSKPYVGIDSSGTIQQYGTSTK